MPTSAAFSLADGAWIFVGFVVVWLIAIAYGYYTRRGSAINQRTYGDVDAPGAKAPSVLSHDRSAARRLIMGAPTRGVHARLVRPGRRAAREGRDPRRTQRGPASRLTPGPAALARP
jgi:hypothetical protein